jgi:hypothetical protein
MKNQIFEEANTDFGLFISNDVTKKKNYEKVKLKMDKEAI